VLVVASVGVTDDAGLGEAVATDDADKATGTDVSLADYQPLLLLPRQMLRWNDNLSLVFYSNTTSKSGICMATTTRRKLERCRASVYGISEIRGFVSPCKFYQSTRHAQIL
jgi:hypothetical protein